MPRRFFLLSLACIISWGCAGDESGLTRQPPYSISAYTGGVATADLPRTSLLHDPANQHILRACLSGAKLDELTRLDVDSLEQRVDQLCQGRVLICEDSIFRPGLPVFTGTERKRLDSLADICAGRLVEPVSVMLEEMRFSSDVEPEQVFHLLWSLIMDQTWYSIWERLSPAEAGPPQVIWIVDPPHDHTVGTNFWQIPGGSIVAATWSPDCHEYLRELTPMRLELLYAAWEMPGNDSADEATLRRYGFLAEDGSYLGLTYRDSTPFAERQSKWRNDYSDEVARCLDLKSAATTLELPEGQTFVMLLHEVAYELFRRLDETNILQYPRILEAGEPDDRIADLVSVRLVRRPLPEDVAMATFMANGWHGTDEVVPLFREVLATDPGNLQIHLLLGMSLYDLERYDEAVVEFKELSRRAATDQETKTMFDWSRVWLGHVYDARGERSKALEWYQAVVADGSPSSEMSFGQYRIAPIDAVAWSRERLTTPFGGH